MHRLHRDACTLRNRLTTPQDQETLEPIIDLLAAMASAEGGRAEKKIGLRDYITHDFRTMLEANNLKGPIAEIGGNQNGLAKAMPEYTFKNLSLSPSNHSDVVTADISNCPQIPNDSFDAVFSVSCFEHIERPWRAAEEITRILKPGGISYHVAPFSYFYHRAPIDHWRYTPDALAFLFRDLEPLRTEFYGANRRRNNVGSEKHRIDSFGEPQFAEDAFGGWRENWHAIYAGRKTPGWTAEHRALQVNEVVVDICKVLNSEGVTGDELAHQATILLSRVTLNGEGELIVAGDGQGLAVSPEHCLQVWQKRGRMGLKPTFRRYARVAIARSAIGVEAMSS